MPFIHEPCVSKTIYLCVLCVCVRSGMGKNEHEKSFVSYYALFCVPVELISMPSREKSKAF